VGTIGLSQPVAICSDKGGYRQPTARSLNSAILRCMAYAETHRHRHAIAAAPGPGARFNALKYLADGSFIPLRQDSNKLIAAPATTFPSFTPLVRRLALLLFDACAQPVDESGFRADVEFDRPPVRPCKTPAFYRVFFSH